MALYLMLRSAQKVQGYSSILRCSPVVFNSTNYVSLPQLTNRTSSSLVQKTPILLPSKILTTPVVRCMSAGGDHRMKWTIERLISVGLIGLLPLTVAVPNAVLDYVTAIAVTLHLHWRGWWLNFVAVLHSMIGLNVQIMQKLTNHMVQHWYEVRPRAAPANVPFCRGIEAMAEDYLRPIVVGTIISKAAIIAVYIVSTVTLGGLLYFNYTDIGIGKVIRKFWSIQPC